MMRKKFVLSGLVFMLSFGFLIAQKVDFYLSKKEKDQEAARHYDRGNRAVMNQQYQLAVIYFDSAVYFNNRFADYYIARGQAKEFQHQDIEALADFELALKIDPANYTSLFKRALIYYKKNRYQQAVRDFTFLINNLGELETKALVFKGVVYDDLGQPMISGISTIDDMKADVYMHRGMVYEQLKFSTPALLDYNKAIELNAHDPNYFVSRGLFKLRKNDKEGAVGDFREALKINPNHRNALYNLSFLVGEEEKDEINQLLFGQGDFARAYSKRAFDHFQKGDYEKALMDYDSALMINPDDASDLMNRGIVRSKLAKYEEAIDDFQASMYADNSLMRNYVMMGNAFQELYDYSRAIELYSRYLERAQPDGVVYYNLGLAYMKNNNRLEACSSFKTAIKLGENRAEKPMEKVCF